MSIDLGSLDRVLEVDPISRAARIQAGASGPELERQLAEHGLTLRHFPQSFELSTLGGWIATRAARALRDRVDAHRGLRGVGARADADGSVGVAPAAGLGRGSQPRPDAGGLGGSPRGHHRGVGARAAAPHPPPLGGRGLRGLRRGRGVRAGAQPVGAEPGQLPADRRARGQDHDGRRRWQRAAGDRLRVHRPPRRRADGAGARDLRASMGARVGRGARRADGRDTVGTWRRRSCALPTCATCSWRWACSAKPSRRRSPGSASPPSASR